MNTMVGLQASLHQKMNDSTDELMKSDSEPLSTGDLDGDDEFSDFDAEELLKTALFNDSMDKLQASGLDEDAFGTFADTGKPPAVPNTSEGFQQAAMFGGAQQVQQQVDAIGLKQQNVYPQAPVPSFSTPIKTTNAVNAPFMPSYNMHQAAAQNMPTQNNNMHQQASAQINNSFQMAQQPMHQVNLVNQGAGLLDQGRPAEVVIHDVASRRISSMSECDSSSMFTPDAQSHHHIISNLQRSLPMRSQSDTSAYKMQNPLQSMSEHSTLHNMQPTGDRQTSLYDLQQMQFIAQNINNNTSVAPLGLSQSMHGGIPTNPLVNNNNNSFNNDSLQGGSMHGTPCSPAYASPQSLGNVSIASENASNKSAAGGIATGAPLGEAMEKLCESMKRSAMSRQLVKNLSGSGRNLVKQNSGRTLSRQNSGLMMRQGSNRSLVNQGSARSLMKQGSSRSLIRQGSNRSLIDDGSGRGTPAVVGPIRRIPNSKHHLQHPGRGVYRHNSHQSLNGSNHNGINLQVDGRNMGNF